MYYFFTFFIFYFLFLDQRLGYRISLNLYVRRHLQLIINSSASLPLILLIATLQILILFVGQEKSF